ncbi:hypothetical protein ENUP19_0346G0041 [Entamoeba nuttalli]|uniref:Rho guanine nucleotide exchange factor, putative n=2 Tax=Entamoeba nuttalli TaxID=412467 RepID=K2GR29_ENTNP|nr:Rho guanine nucleotide exchange factor, putative [Entamoeba nuttalli P19]EKE37423.1 Rho guanine nucleotide exchange factor, putative [Entamoeba nuttalli P19]|eukprot:XP_008860246.1 Rho guanine nucleotide exchange factor, putative [Entamoeba nuttalli P19]
MATTKEVVSPVKHNSRQFNLILQEKQEQLYSEIFEGKNVIELNVNNMIFYLPRMNDCVGIMGIILDKNRDSINKGKPIKVTLDQTLVPAFQKYLCFIDDKRSFIPEYDIKESVEYISDLCRFGTPIQLALNHVVPESLNDRKKREVLLEVLIKGMTSALLNSIMLFNEKKECKNLFIPVLLKLQDDSSIINKLKLWLEMSIVRPRHCTIAFTGGINLNSQTEKKSVSLGSDIKSSKLNCNNNTNNCSACDIISHENLTNNKSKTNCMHKSEVLFKKEYKYTDKQMFGLLVLQSIIRGYKTRKLYNIHDIIQRKQCIIELLQTEQNLHNNMKLMNKYFLQPMSMKQKDKLFKKKVSSIFLTLTRCISSSSIFIEKLSNIVEHYKVDSCVGNSLQMLLPYIAPYLNFTTDYQISLSTWKDLKRTSDVQEILRSNLGVKELENQTLEFLLIQPVQRVMRYPMLIKEIIKLTNKNHPDYQPLKEAFREFHCFSKIANERSKMRDSLQQVAKELGDDELLVDNRYHLWTSEVVSKIESKVYLFNDMVMICTKQKNGKWCISETMQIGGDVEITVIDKIVTVKKFRYTKPLIFELENKELGLKFKSQIEEIIRDDWFNLNDERSWIDLVDRKIKESSD